MASTITAGNATNGLAMSSDSTGILNIKTGTGTGTSVIYADTSQNVGIGTTSPSGSKVHVVSSGNTYLKIEDTLANGYNAATLYKNDQRQFRVGVLGTVGGFTNGALIVYDETAAAWRMVIDQNGSMLVGGTSIPAAGSGAKTYFTIANGYAQAIQRTGSDGPQVAYINAAGNLAGRIDVSGTTCSLFSVSDYRLKENVQPVVGALDKVAQLKPCTYTWKESGNEEQGFIAHELKEVIPSCVSGDKDAVDASGNIIPQAVSMNASIISTLTAAIQELKAELDAVKAKVGA